MKISEIFDYSDRDGQGTIEGLVNILREMGLPVDRWQGVAPTREDLPSQEARELLTSWTEEQGSADAWGLSESVRKDLSRIRVANPKTKLVFAEDGTASLAKEEFEPEIDPRAKALDLQLGRLLGVAIMPDIAAEFGVLEGGDASSVIGTRIRELMVSCNNPALTWAYLRAGDYLAETQVSDTVLSLYRAAVEAAPYPSLCNELGAIFLYRSGIQADDIGGDPKLVWTVIDSIDLDGGDDSYRRLGDVISGGVLAGPVLPEFRKGLLMLALECYSSAYGSFVDIARGAESDVDVLEVVYLCDDAVFALDGIRVILQELAKDEANEAVYWNFQLWAQVDQLVDFDDLLLGRFSYSFGVARGSARGRGLATAERILGTPVDQEREKQFAREIADEIQTTSPAALKSFADEVRSRLADVGSHLPVEVVDLLAQAEYLMSLSHPTEFDWSPVIIQYRRAVQVFLTMTVGVELDAYASGSDDQSFLGAKVADATLDVIVQILVAAPTNKALWAHLVERFPGQEGNLRSIAAEIRTISEYRIGSALGFGSVSIADARRLCGRLFDSSQQGPSLLVRLARLLPCGQTIRELTSKGESEIQEFKQSLRWDYKTRQANTDLEKAVARTIAGFMNKKGGTLLIGVCDDTSVCGIEKDFETLGRRRDRDGWQQKLVGVLGEYLSKEIAAQVTISFEEDCDRKTVAVLRVDPGARPIFVSKTEFHVRSGNTPQLFNTREATDYIKSRFSG